MSQLIKQDKPLTDGRMSHDQKIVDFSVDMATFVVELRVGSWVEYVEGTTPDAITIYKLTNFTDWQPEHAQQLDDLLQALPEWGVSVTPYTPEQVARKISPPSFKSHWDEADRVWVDDRTLLEAQTEKWSSIKAERDELSTGTFEWDGHIFDADVTRINGAVTTAILAQMTGSPYADDWTLADNTVLAVNGSDMIQIGVALANRIKDIFTRGRELRELIYSKTTNAEVDAVIWDTGT